MKKTIFISITIVSFIAPIIGQELDSTSERTVDSTAHTIPQETRDTAITAETVSGLPDSTDVQQNETKDTSSLLSQPSKSPETGYNPFITDGDTAARSAQSVYEDSSINPFLSQREPYADEQTTSESDKWTIDILLDLSAGFGYTRIYDIKPEYISTDGKGNFLFSLGVMIPFVKLLYAKASINYFRVTYATSFTTPNAIDMYVTRTGDEVLSFIGGSVDFGIRLDPEWPVFPFIYGVLEPAFLTTAGRLTVTETYTTFSDNAYLSSKSSENNDITLNRERHQIFIGAGIGCEVNYGYGSVYIDCGFRHPLLEPGDTNSKPERSASKLMYFPLSLGIRFYL